MISKILAKHKCYGHYYPDIENPYTDERCKNESPELEIKLMEKWSSRIGKGWYGFAIGRPCPDAWFYVIDEFLDYIQSLDPEFEIQQIKLKFGGLRFYISYTIDDEELNEFVGLQIDKLERTLYCEKLIY